MYDETDYEVLADFLKEEGYDPMLAYAIEREGCECDVCEIHRTYKQSREEVYEDLVNEEVTRTTGIPVEGGDERRKDAGKAPLHLVPWDTIKCIASELVNRSPSYEVDDECMAGLPNLEPGDALDNLIEFFQNGAELEAPSLTASDIIGVARVLEFGAKKYSARGWEKGIEYSRTFSSGMRHLFALGNGQENDPETGLPHWHHALCNYLFLVRFSHTPGFEKFDDRPLKSEL